MIVLLLKLQVSSSLRASRTIRLQCFFPDPYFFYCFSIDAHGKVTINVSSKFVNIEVYMSQCDDIIQVYNTLESTGYIILEGRGGNDSIHIGTTAAAHNGLGGIHKRVVVEGGLGEEDELHVIDSKSIDDKPNGALSSFSITGLMGTYLNETIIYKGCETVVIDLSEGMNAFEVTSTAPGSMTYINAGDANDLLTIFDTQGSIEVNANGGKDQVKIYGAGDDTTLEVYGNAGDDEVGFPVSFVGS